MPALVKTDYRARITWMGRVPHRDAPEIEGEPVTEMTLSFAGLDGETHAGLTRLSCGRVAHLYPRGTQVRNSRQLSVISREELDEIARDLDLDTLDPRWLGASLVVEGIPDFSHIPPSARLLADSGTCLVVDMLNQPCTLVSRTIERQRPGHGKAFKSAAAGRRGVTASVEREGRLNIGDTLTLYCPGQRAWAPQKEI